MFGYSREVAVSASVEEVLERLEQENQIIVPYVHVSDTSAGRDHHIDFFAKREGNTLVIYGKHYTTPSGWIRPENDDPPLTYDVIRFEVSRITDHRSLIKASYEQDSVEIERMCLTRLARLGLEFGEDWGKAASQELADLELKIQSETGVHWGYTDWKTDERTGMKMRAFALIPNPPEPGQNARHDMKPPPASAEMPVEQEIDRRYQGVHGMLEKIAYRDQSIRRSGKSPNWTYRWKGAIDNKTANTIDEELGGRIRGPWKDTNVSGDRLAALLFEAYPDFAYLKDEWEELRNKEF